MCLFSLRTHNGFGLESWRHLQCGASQASVAPKRLSTWTLLLPDTAFLLLPCATGFLFQIPCHLGPKDALRKFWKAWSEDRASRGLRPQRPVAEPHEARRTKCQDHWDCEKGHAPAAPPREATPAQKLSRGTGPAGEPGAEVTRASRPGSLPAPRQPQALSPSIIQSLRHIKMDLKRHFTLSLLSIHIITTHRLLF